MTHKIIFFDTETTGNTDKDFLCQLAYKTGGEEFNQTYKPPIKIPAEASAVHHISNKMVEDRPAFKDSEDYAKVKELFEDPEVVMVAHNAPFDLKVMEKENIIPKRFICTLRVARHMDPENKIPRYNLQYLRYFLEMEIEATAHDAMGDVLVLEQFYPRLFKKIQDAFDLDDDQTVEKMIEISSTPSLMHSFNFGKHTGKKVSEVAAADRGYLEWLLNQKLQSDQNEEDWIYTLKHYLGME